MSPHAKIDPVVFILHSAGAVRQSLEALLRASGWRTEAYDTAREFLRQPLGFVPGCLVLDVVLADMCGFELQRQLAGICPQLELVFVATCAGPPEAVRAIKGGAADFLILPLDHGEVLRAVGEAIERSNAVLARDAELRALGENYASLSGREREVMALVTLGLLNKQVGAKLGISEITVKAHRGQVMRKMKARSFADLVRKAANLRIALRTSDDIARPDMAWEHRFDDAKDWNFTRGHASWGSQQHGRLC